MRHLTVKDLVEKKKSPSLRVSDFGAIHAKGYEIL